MRSLIRSQLKNELNSAKSEVLSMFASLSSSANIHKLVEAPDVFISVVAMSKQKFYLGRGDKTTFFKTVL
jgi:hypothetical protein